MAVVLSGAGCGSSAQDWALARGGPRAIAGSTGATDASEVLAPLGALAASAPLICVL